MNKKFLKILNSHEREDDAMIGSEEEIVREMRREIKNSEEIIGLMREYKVTGRQFFSDDSFPDEWPVIPIRQSDGFDIHKHTTSQRPYFHDHDFYELIYVYRGKCVQRFCQTAGLFCRKNRRVCCGRAQFTRSGVAGKPTRS